MAQQGTVTITAKVNASQAEAALKSLGGAASRIAVDYQRASEVQARAARGTTQLYEQQAKAATQVAELRRRMEDQIARSTMTSVEYRIHAIKREAQETDKAIRQMAISRKQQEDLIYRNVAAMEAQITAVMRAEAEKRKAITVEAVPAAAPSLASRISSAGLVAGSVAVGASMAWSQIQPAIDAASKFEEKMQALEIITSKTGRSFAEANGLVKEFSDGITSMGSVAEAVSYLSTMNVSLDDQRKLIGLIRDGLTSMGKDVDSNLAHMVLALKRGESSLFDNMGVMRTAEMMLKEYARSIGTTTEKLSQQQREAAIVQGAIKDLTTYEGTAIAASDDYSGSKQRLTTATQELNAALGSLLLPTLKETNSWLTDIAKGATKAAEKFKEFRESETTAAVQMGAASRFGQMPDVAPLYRPTSVPTPLIVSDAERQDAIANATKARIAAEKAAEEARIKGTEEAQKKAEEARKKAEQLAKQAAADQVKLREQLAKDLLLVDAIGAEQQRIQAKIHLDAMIAQAHGSAQLEADARKLYWKRVNQIDREEEAKVKAQNDATRKKYGDGGLWFDDTISRVKTDEGNLRKQETQGVHDLFKEHFSEREKLENDLIDKRKRGEEEIGRARKQYAEDAARMVGSFAANAIRTGKGPSGGESLRTGSNVLAGGLGAAAVGASGTVVGLPVGVVLGAAAALTKIAGEIGGAVLDRGDDEAAHLQAEAAQRQQEAADKQLETARRQGDLSRDYQNQLLELERRADQETRLAEAQKNGPEAVEQVQRAIASEDHRREALDDLRRLGTMRAKYYGASEYQRSMFGNTLAKYAEDGDISDEERTKLLGYIPEEGQHSASGQIDRLVELLNKRLALDPGSQDRVLPGSSPQSPNYTIMLNAKDIWASMPASARSQAQGPGTSRDVGGSGRGIDVGGKR
jgi:hypothetical protein